MNIYDTNTEKLTCTCEDWKQTRKEYPIDDPRRLCKHIINKLDIDNLSDNLKYFKEDIKFYKSKEWGFTKDFEKVLKLPINGYIILQDHYWMNVYDNNGNKYGYLYDTDNNKHVWAKNEKPVGYKEVENHFRQKHDSKLISFQGNEKSTLINFIKKNIPSKQDVSFSFEEAYSESFSDSYMFFVNERIKLDTYYEENTEYKIKFVTIDKYKVSVFMENGNIFFYDRDYDYALSCRQKNMLLEEQRLQREEEIFEKERQEYEKKLSEKRDTAKNKGYLWEIKDSLYREAITYCNRDHDAQYTEYIEATYKISDEYSDLKKLLKSSKSDITSALFNKTLNNLKMIKKVKTLNLNDWIIIDDGLKYGINIEKDSKYFSETIPDWYKVTTLDAHTLELVEQRDRQNVRMTRILWKNNQFEKLLDLVVETIKNQNAEERINELEKNINSKQSIREEWFKNVSCHNCGSKNIHKKNKRVYGYGTVQRYQCQDCKSIFQEKIQDNIHLDETNNQVSNHHEECKGSLESNTINNIQAKTNYFKEIYEFVKEKTGLIK
ncbi:transposase family protein [Candidatus Sulfurimonas baltica]|uniref:Transposase family protein n=1 Tax=Candidatus Sulfurimonas baltica TaxID=2740404 RepID=A0A7S7RPB4_9BACT|nr:transposase family protein [Candidatus Sulfurimonas baltica]QOY53323.1 transposase family protein [Candidatus Sulfurimonas baltica]